MTFFEVHFKRHFITARTMKWISEYIIWINLSGSVTSSNFNQTPLTWLESRPKAILNQFLCSFYPWIPHTHACTRTHTFHLVIRKGKHGVMCKASNLTDGRVGQSAPKKTLRVRRASVLGAVDHNLSVDPCGSGARCCGGSCWKLRALSRDHRVLFFVEKGDRQEIRKGRRRHVQKQWRSASTIYWLPSQYLVDV